MSISFNSIPANARVPFTFIEFDNSKAIQGATLKAYRGLIMGQKLSAGTATANAAVRVTSLAQAKTLFGQGSMLAGMVDAWLNNNAFTELWVIPVADNGAGVQATGTLAFTGPATAAGTLSLYIGGKVYEVAVASGDTATEVGDAVAAAIEADADAIVNAANITGTVTLTHKHKGTVGNEIDLRLNYQDGEALPTGIACTVTGFASGATNPSLTSAISAMAEVQYDVIAFPWTDATSLTAIEAELDDRWGPLRQNDGRAFAAKNDTHSNLGTLGDGRNSPHLTIMAAYKEPKPFYEKAAAYAAVAAGSLNIDPARPLQTLTLKGMLAAKQEDQFTLSERNLLLFDGIATSFVDAGGLVRIERAITTYKTSALGAEDASYLDITTMATLSYLRYDFRNYILLKYPRHKLANDGTRFGAGQAVMTPKLGKAEAIAKFRQWEELGLVEGFDQFKNDLIVERNATDVNRLDWYLAPDLMNSLVVNGIQIGFLL